MSCHSADAWKLEHVARKTVRELLSLPGVDPKTVEILRLELHIRGLTFAPEQAVS